MSKDTLGKLLWEWRAGRDPAAHSLLSGGSQEWEWSVWEEKETISKPCRSLQGHIVKRQSLCSSSRLGLMMPGTQRHVYFLPGPRSLEAWAMSVLVATPVAAWCRGLPLTGARDKVQRLHVTVRFSGSGLTAVLICHHAKSVWISMSYFTVGLPSPIKGHQCHWLVTSWSYWFLP